MAIGISRKMLNTLLLKQEILDQSTDLSLSASSSSRILQSKAPETESTFLLMTKSVLHFLWISICSILARFGFLSTSNREKAATTAAKIKSVPGHTDKMKDVIKIAVINEDELLIVKQLVDGYFMRGKALLAASRPHLAKKVGAFPYLL